MLRCYRPQTKFAKVMSLQVFVCPHRGVGGIPACIAGGIPACLAAGLLGGGIPECLAGFQAHTQGGSWRGISPGRCLLLGVPAPGGACSRGGVETPPPWRLLLQAVRILLECILVNGWNYVFGSHEIPESQSLSCSKNIISTSRLKIVAFTAECSSTLRWQRQIKFNIFLFSVAITMWTPPSIAMIPIFSIAIAVRIGSRTHSMTTPK